MVETNDLPNDESVENTMSYEEAVQKLEKLVNEIETGNVPINTLIEKVEGASQLIRFCREQITSTESKVVEVVRSLQEDLE